MKIQAFLLRGLQLLLLLLLSKAAFSQEMSEYDDPGLHKSRFAFKHGFDTFYKRNDNPERSEDQAAKTYDLFLSLPIYQNEKFSTSVFAKTQELHLASLPANSIFTGNDFYDQQYGLKMSYLEDADDTWHLNTSYGSASDKPFANNEVSALNLTLVHKHTIDPTNSWTWFLNYSNNRSFLNHIPLPGFAYSFTNNYRTQGWVLGFPFSLWWARTGEKVSTTVFFLLPATIKLTLGYMFRPPFQANLKLQLGQDMYSLVDRREKDIRFYYENKKISASLKTLLAPQTFFEIELGKVFSRAIYDGRSPLNLTSDRLQLEDEWQLMVSGQAAF
jgi:hypothetical protein